MSDGATEHIDALVAKSWPDISKAVREGLAAKPELKTLVGVDSWRDAPAPRLVAPAWKHHPLTPTPRLSDPPCTRDLRVSAPWGDALEVRLTTTIAADQLADTPDEAARTAGRLALLTSDFERRSVIGIVCAAAEQGTGTPTLRAVRDQTDPLLGGRLITRRPALAEAARRTAAFESVSEDVGVLPPSVDTLVVATYSGPLVRWLTDGLTLSWTRVDEESIRLRVSGRFFVDNAGQSVAFVR